MNLLRAQVRAESGWWEIKLLDLDIAADGASEDEMLRQLEESLIAEYHLALDAGKTPFVAITLAIPTEAHRPWQGNPKKLRPLNLPDEVQRALAAALRQPTLTAFGIDKDAA
jgi:hypothetical protein